MLFVSDEDCWQCLFASVCHFFFICLSLCIVYVFCSPTSHLASTGKDNSEILIGVVILVRVLLYGVSFFLLHPRALFALLLTMIDIVLLAQTISVQYL